MNKTLIQCTSHILMVRPAQFGFNPETAASNAFQQTDDSMSPEEIKIKAQEEFDGFVEILRYKGINVHVAQDNKEPIKPDAVFPNNWISFHENGYIITYPMQAVARRKERRDEIIYQLAQTFDIQMRYYMEFSEEVGLFLEGTGSMIFDREHALVYACLSPRTDSGLLERFCQITGYQSVVFTALDDNNQEIYHTNVMMAMGDTFVVICLDAIKNPEEQTLVVSSLERSGKEIVRISMAQMNAFAGNMLQVRNDAGQSFLVMSSQAFDSLDSSQIESIEKHTEILHAPIYTIEKYGGGSARCMMAEIFLPLKTS